MKGEFVIPVTVIRTIDCFGCDHCKDNDKVKTSLIGLRKKVTYGYRCDALNIELSVTQNINSDHMPCDASKWQQSNEDFDITEDVFTLEFKDAKLLPVTSISDKETKDGKQ